MTALSKQQAAVFGAVLAIAAGGSSPASFAQDDIVTIATDFTSGFLSTVQAEPPWSADENVAPTHSDARVRTRDRAVYVVNREGQDNIQILDADGGFSTLCQFSTGPSSNPSDIILVSDHKAYVPLYDEAELLVVDPAACEILGSVDLSSFADGDGVPEMDRGIFAAGRVFVGIQRLDTLGDYEPVPPSYLAVIDPETDTLVDADPDEEGVQGIELTGTNPFTEIQRDPDDLSLLVGSVGSFFSLDGGIEKIDPVSMTSLGWVVTEEELNGNILAFRVLSASQGFAVISDAGFNTCLVEFNPGTGSFVRTIFCTEGFLISQDVILHDGWLIIGDRDLGGPGLRIFDSVTGNQVAGPVSVGLPPDDMAVLHEFSAGAPDAASAFRLGRPYPNPASGWTTVSVELARDSRVVVSLVDPTGRRVAQFPRGRLPAGRHELRLDLDRTAGLAGGSYWLTVEGLGVRGARLTVLR